MVSRLSTSKRIFTMSMRSQIVSSLVDLSITCTGVVTLPQSCSQAAMRSSYHSSSVRSKDANGPSRASHAAFVSISVTTGTRSQ